MESKKRWQTEAGLNTNVNGRVMKGFYPSRQSQPVPGPVTTLGWLTPANITLLKIFQQAGLLLCCYPTRNMNKVPWSGCGATPLWMASQPIEILICLPTVKTKTLKTLRADFLKEF